jgi:hypothetical protein
MKAVRQLALRFGRIGINAVYHRGHSDCSLIVS